MTEDKQHIPDYFDISCTFCVSMRSSSSLPSPLWPAAVFSASWRSPVAPAHLLAHLLLLSLINHLVYIAVHPTLCLLDSPVWVHPQRHIAANELSLFLVLVLLPGSFVWFCLLSLPESLMSLSTLGFKMRRGDFVWKARHIAEYSFKTSEMHPWSDYSNHIWKWSGTT